MYVGTSKVTSKGQVTIPLEIRKSEELGTGSSVVFVEVDGEIVMAKVSELKKLFSVFQKRAQKTGLSRARLLQETKTERKKSMQKYFSE